MVLGLRSKSKKGSSVQVDLIIYLEEIKPWPPTQSLKAQNSVILHWEGGDKHSGSTRSVTPQIGPDFGDGKIVFNESFLFPTTLYRESSTKGSNLGDNEKFQKKCLELNLYEARNERAMKGQLLGSAMVDLAEYGILKDVASVSVPLVFKRGTRNTAHPSLFFSIGPYDKNSASHGFNIEREHVPYASASSSSKDSLSNRTSLDKDTRDAIVAALMSDEDAEEAEIASFTDDEHSSRSLSPVSTSTSEAKVNSPFTKSEHILDVQQVEEKNIPKVVESNEERVHKVLISSAQALPVKTAAAAAAAAYTSKRVHSSTAAYTSKRVHSSRDGLSSRASSTDVSSDPDSLANDDIFASYETRSPILIARSPIVPRVCSSSASASPAFERAIAEGDDNSITKGTTENEVPLEVNGEKKLAGKDGRENTEVNSVYNAHKKDLDRKDEGKEPKGIEVNAINNADYSSENKEPPEFISLQNNQEKDARKKSEESELVGDIASKQALEGVVEEKVSGQNSAKLENESNYMNFGSKKGKCEPGVQALESKNTAENQIRGIRTTEVSEHKVALPRKVVAKEGGNRLVEPGPRAAKGSMERQMGGKQTPKPSRDPPRKASKGTVEVRNGSKGGAGLRTKSVHDNKPQALKVPVKSMSDTSLNFVAEVDDKLIEEVKEISVSEAPCTNAGNGGGNEAIGNGDEITLKETKGKVVSTEERVAILEDRVRQMEMQIEKLEGELRETAAIEIAIYTVAAEHGSSSHKVHSPARRIARLYIHACKHWSQDRRASVARNTASGLIFAAKACGNDVPRLTFWWSNTVVLREIVSQAFDSSQVSPGALHISESNGARTNQRLLSPHNLSNSHSKQLRQRFSPEENPKDWHETQTFTTALEKIESWIYARVIESVWWQTLTPHMQCPTKDAFRGHIGLYLRKSFGKLLGPELGDRQQGKFSIELWKKAFLDTFQRLCPVRGGGHECGCLPILSKMVMEQCVARLDVAMFNAILRESEDDMPTDPVSDPISDPNVLPIPAGKLSFGAGAQLKNAVGNWSRWLTDLVGLDAEDLSQEGFSDQEGNIEVAGTCSSFSLLNATSDLLMLPKDMLMDKSIRKEVCPVLSLPLIKRVLSNFVPDEFCPDAVPSSLLEALNSEAEADSTYNFPFSATPILYNPPPAFSPREIGGSSSYIHLERNVSSVLRRGHTSDDELDELGSPFSLLIESVQGSSPKVTKLHDSGKSSVSLKQSTDEAGVNRRYQLLREVWADK